jgi:hypothetical protein
VARQRPNRIQGQFVYKLVELLESPAHRVLSLSALRVLDRILIEHANHGGKENGKLPVTYEHFVELGMDRHAIAPAIRELAALGFIEITERGHPSAGEFRNPNKFRLTFIPTKSANPTHEWRKIENMVSARVIAQQARRASKHSAKSTRPQTASNGNIKNKKPVGVNDQHSVGNPHRNGQMLMSKTLTTDPVLETPHYLYISGRLERGKLEGMLDGPCLLWGKWPQGRCRE